MFFDQQDLPSIETLRPLSSTLAALRSTMYRSNQHPMTSYSHVKKVGCRTSLYDTIPTPHFINFGTIFCAFTCLVMHSLHSNDAGRLETNKVCMTLLYLVQVFSLEVQVPGGIYRETWKDRLGNNMGSGVLYLP